MLTQRCITILVAVAPDAVETATRALGQGFDLTFCDSLDDLRLLSSSRHFDLIVCGMYFGGGRLFDLLRYARASVRTMSTPILCIKAVDETLPSAAMRSIEHAALALGADGFVDLLEWCAEDGEAQAFAKLCSLIRHETWVSPWSYQNS